MEKLLEILEDLVPDVDFSVEEKLIDDGVLDSFDIISLVSDIDDEFGVKVPVDQLIPENFNSSTSIWNLIQRLKDID